MIVVTMRLCPSSLKGDMTKWFFEVSPGVYVGRMTSRVRDRIWDRILSECKGGAVTMVYGAANEQRFRFRTHNTEWKVEDFDGLKIMRKPLPEGYEFVDHGGGRLKIEKHGVGRKKKQ